VRSARTAWPPFAAAAGLTVIETDPGRRLMRVEGRAAALQAAFATQLHRYRHGALSFRARTGSLSAPGDVAPHVEAVLGLDQRPIATPKSIRLAHPAADAGFLPNAVAGLYGFPTPKGLGAGETVALIELGGGFTASDTDAAFAAMGLSPSTVVAVPVSGGANQPGKDSGADGEVALDIQVAGGGAPGARLAVYFAANTDQGFVDAISQAAHDQTYAPSVMSISWGSAEDAWTGQAVAAMTSALQDAADLGLTVLAASGDGLATDGASDGKAHVDFPASSPLVLGCGGTRLQASRTAITGETVWNSQGGGTGGGISDLFPVPAYQGALVLPADVNGPRKGRGVPDVASNAAPETGYRVIVDGQSAVIGGTSAAAPLWAALFALTNAMAGKPSGQPHATLYARAAAFNDITSGNDKTSDGLGYVAAKGWDACTGLGSPKGAAIAALFAK
jgi:kumamolisin